MDKSQRVLYCFNCNDFRPVITDDYKAIIVLKAFKKTHVGHRLQVINKSEMENRPHILYRV